MSRSSNHQPRYGRSSLASIWPNLPARGCRLTGVTLVKQRRGHHRASFAAVAGGADRIRAVGGHQRLRAGLDTLSHSPIFGYRVSYRVCWKCKASSWAGSAGRDERYPTSAPLRRRLPCEASIWCATMWRRQAAAEDIQEDVRFGDRCNTRVSAASFREREAVIERVAVGDPESEPGRIMLINLGPVGAARRDCTEFLGAAANRGWQSRRRVV